ncbi:Lcl C-terminal domain-containing protein [Xylophilus ampelinus]|uniref:Uncharacterized protein DUF1566 n=1 Tax=Xylophilus ampelinus TaxID=54067 RepID=A0A318T1W9_9BURK|nr:DUF1566 domain-containing protein [Xylophilus ampelinus]MCS4508915.1 DUF1566 domain-containing protein [Xylophilus ampelinus]PYE79481.1 uncharacterized protein DUF1566 [Xylophilus ampelinus]
MLAQNLTLHLHQPISAAEFGTLLTTLDSQPVLGQAAQFAQAAAGADATAILHNLPSLDSFPPAIGQHWPAQGGTYAGILRGIDGEPDCALIVAPAAGGETTCTWGPRDTDAGETSDIDGRANTLLLAGLAEAYPAARWALRLRLDGFEDWYMPARRELQLIAANAPEAMDPKPYYWSSTQYSRHYAWLQDFENGTSNNYGKGNECRARAVRRIQL